MIKAIIFDCFGVLTADLWREFCNSLPPGPAVDKARELNHQYDAGAITQHDFLKGVLQVTGRKPQEVEKILDVETGKNTALLNYIAQLKPAYKIGLLSNIATNWIRTGFLTAAEQNLFDDMIFSYQVGLTKPDRRIFELAASRLKLAPENCVLVDDIASYCQAAKATGMQAIVYTDFVTTKQRLQTILGQSG